MLMNEVAEADGENEAPIDRIRMGRDVSQFSKSIPQWHAGNHEWSSGAVRFNNHPMKTVFLVDGSCEFRLALSRILGAAGYYARLFESAEQFLATRDTETPGCLLAEILLPGMSGLELQRALPGSPWARPIVFLTDNVAIQTSVQAMKAGAVDFLTKPIDDARLIAAVEQALQRDAQQRQERAIGSIVQRLFESLTPRERQVLERIVRGHLNKQIAANLGIGEKTVKAHRGRLMSKMGARSVPELVHLSARVGVMFESPLGIGSEASNWRHDQRPMYSQLEQVS
jgi:FixJ family two-component response regulator